MAGSAAGTVCNCVQPAVRKTSAMRGCVASARSRGQGSPGQSCCRWCTASLLLNSHQWPRASAVSACPCCCAVQSGRRRV